MSNDPLFDHSQRTREFFDAHSSPDADPIFHQQQGDHAVRTIENPIQEVERDEDGNVVSLRLRHV